MKKVILGIIFTMLLTACGSTSVNDNPSNGNNNSSDEKEPMYEGVSGFIISLSSDEMLVIGIKDNEEATYYSFNDKTIVEDGHGDWLSYKDLRIGQFVDTYYRGGIAESYPMQGGAAKVIIHSDATYPPATGIANAISTLDVEDDYPYIYAFNKDGDFWTIEISFLNQSQSNIQFKINEDGEIIE
ncbi:hypothetical protein CIB95_03620 [Lottiidibacillus patelloidae]|uniref:PepSY domain-containing protein n=1 Tax=Lottiidibacillus patelloidae TaxID=2670334 RepID=A0A263BY67_9BACI|nr:DUF3221 domain-containing protein [Lottiidibacillus patelloidae]OZM58669.1 hypothetical protein CIB95_03620 [Lottiidibacillus patelloidae]